MDSIIRDLRFAIRSLVRNPGLFRATRVDPVVALRAE